MSTSPTKDDSAWSYAAEAAALFAVDPVACGGVRLHASPGPIRDRWLALIAQLLPPSCTIKRIPLHVSDSRLLGGLDLSATLRAGRPIIERGLLAQLDGGVALLAMAERLPLATAARLTAVLDTGEVIVERDGLALRESSRFAVIALDEGLADDEQPPAALLDRFAFALDLSQVRSAESAHFFTSTQVDDARARMAAVEVPREVSEALCAVALTLGVASLRAALLAVRVARIAAALAGRDLVTQDDAATASRFVLAPRATRLPAPNPPPETEEESEDDDGAQSQPGERDAQDTDESTEPVAQEGSLEDLVVAAAQAALPPALLAKLSGENAGRARTASAGRSGAPRNAAARGRPIGVRQGELRSGVRLNIVETLRVAAPWQRLRHRERDALRPLETQAAPIVVYKSDLRVTRFKQRSETTAIFVVDASGSSALQRLAEAKGAVELLLAECYVRRDQVALFAFRGRDVQLLLPPTRSLVRAKRSLASLPGGGGTPLAVAIEAATQLADTERRRGRTPVIVLLTDGRANIARDGRADRPRAEQDAVVAAREVRAAGTAAVLVDTSRQPQALAQRLANEMHAVYLPLPYANAKALLRTVRGASSASRSS